jgi:hypothetical protein
MGSFLTSQTADALTPCYALLRKAALTYSSREGTIMTFRDILTKVSTAAREAVAAGTIVPSDSRGVFRRVLALSAPRLEALRRGQDLEVTTQRTIVALAATGPIDSEDLLGDFTNELQVGAGVYVPTIRFGVGDSGNRRVDLARLLWEKQVVLRLTEMKRSRASDSPRNALEQAFEGYAWIRELRQLGVTPYDLDLWPEVDHIQLEIMGPANWFARHGGVSSAIRMLSAAQGEIAQLTGLRDVGVRQRPIVLDGCLWNAECLLRNFDSQLLEAAIRKGGASDALEVLCPARLDGLRSSLYAALQLAEAN